MNAVERLMLRLFGKVRKKTKDEYYVYVSHRVDDYSFQYFEAVGVLTNEEHFQLRRWLFQNLFNRNGFRYEVQTQFENSELERMPDDLLRVSILAFIEEIEEMYVSSKDGTRAVGQR